MAPASGKGLLTVPKHDRASPHKVKPVHTTEEIKEARTRELGKLKPGS